MLLLNLQGNTKIINLCNFNTSYVVIKLGRGAKSLVIYKNFNTSYVVIKPLVNKPFYTFYYTSKPISINTFLLFYQMILLFYNC